MDDFRDQNVNLSEEQIAAQGKPIVPSSSDTTLFKKHPDQVPASAKPVLIDAEGLQKTLQGLTNMALAHEIALNKDFKLKKPERTTEEPVSKEVQLALEAKEKYWQKVDQILMEKNIKDAKNTILDLIHTLRTMLHGTMLPHNVKLRLKIDQEVDMHKVSNEIDNDAFDFVHYMTFILDTLSMLCCPVRDKEIVEIRNIDVPSRQVRKTIDLMENMNLDMANFIISQSRQHIVQNCVTYERTKFASYVELQYKMASDPINVTREWVRRHTVSGRSFSEVMAYAFLEILEWGDRECPETLTLDWGRFPPIREEIRRVTIIGAMVAAVYDYARTLLLDSPEDANDFEKSKMIMMKNLQLLTKLREELNLLITCEEVSDPKKYQEALERCCIQAVIVVEQHHMYEKCQGITSAQKENIMGIIRPLIDLNHPVRLLYYRRVKEWFAEVAKEDGRGRAQAPPNLSIVGPLILVPVTELLRIAMYNRGVYDVIYREIFDDNCPTPTFYPSMVPGDSASDPSSPVPPVDEGIVNILMKLQGITDRAVICKKFQVDPIIKTMPNAEEQPTVPEMPEMNQKHYDEYLLANEPTLKEDYEGVHVFNAGDPDWMLGYTTEQLLKIMERENIVNANKLRRIKERLEQQDVLEQRVADNLPAFEKVWREEVGPSQNEFCRLQQVLRKGSTSSPPSANANAESKDGKRLYETSELDSPSSTDNPDSQFETSSFPAQKDTSDADRNQFPPGLELNQSNSSEN